MEMEMLKQYNGGKVTGAADRRHLAGGNKKKENITIASDVGCGNFCRTPVLIDP
jgi:hypothetical protein